MSRDTVSYKGYTIKIEQDVDPLSPRNDDNLGTMVCWHKRYDLGDKQPKDDPNVYIKQFAEGAVILPLYLYDHSGITISTTPFSCPWDSGQVGFIYCTLQDAVKAGAYGADETSTWDTMLPLEPTENQVPSTLRELVQSELEAEVKTYNQYLCNELCGWVVEDGDGETVDSCWGYYPEKETGDVIQDFAYVITKAKLTIDRLFEKQTQEKK